MTTPHNAPDPVAASQSAANKPAPYQVMPPLDDEQYAELRESIRRKGVLVPIDVDEFGNVLDGHHRQRIARELGIACPSVVNNGIGNDVAKRAWALTVNLVRRNLADAAERRAMVAELLAEYPYWSDRRIAKVTGSSHPTVATVRDEISTGKFSSSPNDYRRAKDGTPPPANARRTGLDGRARSVPARKKPKLAGPVNPPRSGELFAEPMTASDVAGAVRTLAASRLPVTAIAAALGTAALRDVVQASALLGALSELLER
ncbi:ParB N-terminal domain-containing protein [Cupriavidus sp. AcVe19-6a]|uniref:ParB N-terminal domain-containing protein n=1 Tax=Cupriavidus sp. AcVe19-6a TaxID=2821358 RepID=UPI001AE89CBE|nr:ParB N-terminal domain-containing protein [Cupriavidus sp. AcVe19-6a]MBP0634245.1 ParB N-terminal domain-containing protein [Cupriavidus sp. AcVe19-6a]